MTEPATAARYRLDVAGLRHPLLVVSFRGREALSQPFAFTLEVLCDRLDITVATLMYRSAFLALNDDGAGFHGQIQAVERSHHRTGQTCLQMTLGPRLACLAQRYTPRVFQHMSATRIISQVLAEHGMREGSYRFHLKAPCAERPFCAQYLENDLQFVQRLCAEEGIHYHFSHSPQGHQLLFGSGLFGARRSLAAPWRAGSGEAGVTRFTVCHAGASRPASRAAQRAEGHSTLASLNCGQLLPLSGHPHAAFNQLWRVTDVEHQGNGTYANRFVARPWDAPVTLAPVPAMVLPVLMRGWVVGPYGQVAERDAGGRVRVQFEWVMQGNGAQFADCWLAVQAGVQGPLCGGMEVLASPSREAGREPQVIACLASGERPPAGIPETPEPVQARFEAAWLLGSEGRLRLEHGPELNLACGGEVTIQVGSSRFHLDAKGLTLSGPSLKFTRSGSEPAIGAAQVPGDIPQAQAPQQGKEQEGQP